MREGARNFIVGVTSAGALLGLAGLLMSFGELDRYTNPRYQITVLTNNAAGLRAGGGVEFNGVPVGIVHAVGTETADAAHPVRVHLAISDHVILPADVVPTVFTPLIGGSAVLQLTSPPHDANQPLATLPTDGSASLTAELSGGMFDAIASTLDERMKPLMESLEKFNRLADTFTSVGENLNTLMQTQDGASLANGEPPNLRTAVVRINLAIEEATEGLRLAKEWLNDENLKADVNGAVTKANQLIDKATQAVDHYTQLADSMKGNADDITKRAANVADQLAATLEDVRSLARKANAGEGTMGQMLNNPDLYNALTEAAVRLEKALVELQLFIQKVKAEGLPFKLF